MLDQQARSAGLTQVLLRQMIIPGTEQRAKAARGRGGITLDTLTTLDEMGQVVSLQEDIWGYGRPGAALPYPERCLFALVESGGLVGGAYRQGELIAFSLAWQGRDKHLAKDYLHSQLVGVREPYRNHNLGYKLKLQQRDFTLSEGLNLIKWTFDPLKPRNANLNLRKLGAVIRSYQPDYYGALESAKGLAADRFWVEWYIDSARVMRRLDQPGRFSLLPNCPIVTRVAVAVGGNGLPSLAGYDLTQIAGQLLVEIPADFDQLLSVNRGAAQVWQRGIRDIFLHYLASGYLVDDFHVVGAGSLRRAYYQLSRQGLSDMLAE